MHESDEEADPSVESQALLGAFAGANVGGVAAQSLAMNLAALKAMVANLPATPLPAASKFLFMMKFHLLFP